MLRVLLRCYMTDVIPKGSTLFVSQVRLHHDFMFTHLLFATYLACTTAQQRKKPAIAKVLSLCDPSASFGSAGYIGTDLFQAMSPTNAASPILGRVNEIPIRSGRAFQIKKGQRLTVIDPRGGQVSDLMAFNAADTNEVISSGRTLDYASRIYLSTNDPLYSNRSNIMLRIVEDTVGRHDFLLTPCSKDTFRIIYGDQDPHQGCFGNLSTALEPYRIIPDQIPTAFNCFMNVPIDSKTGELRVEPPLSRAGDHITFVAEMDLIMALTACSALQSNGGSFKPIEYRVDEASKH